MALEVKLVMTPQLLQAIKILQLSLPELGAVVQNELDDRCWCGQKHGDTFTDAQGQVHTRARKP
jgi:DNA-directed RNA polymerase specialized sigma54-like protein